MPDDPVLRDLLRHMREVNVQNPEYAAIKMILECGLDGYNKLCLVCRQWGKVV